MQNIYDTDVLIIGGGPAGLSAAEVTASSGIKTLLIEKENQIGYPVHTSGATAVKTMLDFDIPQVYYHLINRIRISSPDESVLFEDKNSLGCIIDVQGVYKHLALKAQNKGAIVLTGIEAVSPLLADGQVVGCNAIKDSSVQIKFNSKVLIDAGGYNAIISTMAGLHQGFNRFGVGAEYELIAPKCRQDEVVLIVGNRYAPSGYAWVCPWGNERVRVGVGILHADSKANPKEYLSRFVKESKLFDIDLEGSNIVEYHYGLVPANGMSRKLVGPGIMSVGDAAGQASLVVGEGIRLSLQAGVMAGQAAVEAIRKGNLDNKILMRYEQDFKSLYGRDLYIGHLLNVKMAHWDDKKWNKHIREIKEMPLQFIFKLLQSEFSSMEVVKQFVIRPYYWKNVLKCGWKLLASRY